MLIISSKKSDNDSFNPAAAIHNADSCAVQLYGCTDVTALNYDSCVSIIST